MRRYATHGRSRPVGAAVRKLLEEMRDVLLEAVAQQMGLADAKFEMEPLKLLIYEPGGHFDWHADTEKSSAMVASATLVLPGDYEGGALVG